MKRLSRGLSGGGTACRILAILSCTVPGKETFLHCFQLVQKIFCQSYLKFYCSTRIWTLNWNCIARHCPWAYLAEILPPACPNGFWSSNPWIRILIRIHLKCWIRIRIRIHSSGVVDPWHFGMDPDPEPRIRTTYIRILLFVIGWQDDNKQYVVFFKVFSLITFWRDIYNICFISHKIIKIKVFLTFFACCWQDPILYKMLTNPEGPKTYGSGSTTMIFYVKT
jgi:hypothetical protein